MSAGHTPPGPTPWRVPALFAIGAVLVGAVGVSASLLADRARSPDATPVAVRTGVAPAVAPVAPAVAPPPIDDGAAIADALLADLAALGLTAADLSLPTSEAVAAPVVAPSVPARPARPRLVVAGVPRTPFEGAIDPLVLLVTESDPGRLARLSRGCTTWDHPCIVIACPPAQAGCVAGWQATWAALSTDEAVVGHPGVVADALAASPHGEPVLGTRLYVGRLGTLGFSVYEREIR